jgi:c-di-GMP-binding flagellar brake protein YcgR
MNSQPSVSPSENRRHQRATLDIRVVWVEGRGSTVRGAVGRACDISEGGISAVLPVRIPLGEVSELQFSLPGIREPFRTRVVVRSSDGFRYGFEFLALSQAQRDAIRRVCGALLVMK